MLSCCTERLPLHRYHGTKFNDDDDDDNATADEQQQQQQQQQQQRYFKQTLLNFYVSSYSLLQNCSY